MSDPLAAQIAAATAYQEFFVPALFEEWAPRMLTAAGVDSGHRVLDVACGTGVLSRAAARVVGSRGMVAGLDLNPGMLTVARRLESSVDWRAGRAEALPFADEGFDAVVSQFGLMFFSDRVGALKEMWRVLRPKGRLAVAVWASLDDTPAYAAEVALLERRAGSAAADALRAPFVLGDPTHLSALFDRAGIPEVRVTTITGSARFPSVRQLVETDLRGWLPLMGVVLPEPLIATILAEAEQVFQPFLAADGSVVFASPAHIATASRVQ